MAHKTFNIEDGQAKKRKQYRMPDIQGKFGIGIMLGGKEIFFGVSVNTIIVEQVVKRRLLRTPKSTTKVFNFD